MMGLDHSGLAQAAFDNVWINGTLYQEVYSTNLLGLFLKYPDKLLADNLTLLLRLGYPLQLLIETLLGIDTDKVQIIWAFWAKYSLNLIPLILAKESMVNKYAGQLLADGLGHEDSCHRGIHAAGQGTESLAVADFLLQLLYSGLYEGIHPPISLTMAYIVHEIAQHLGTLNGMEHLWMELDSIEALGCIFHGSYRTYRGAGCHAKALWSLGDIVSMAHPADGLVRYASKKLGILANNIHLSLAVLADRSGLHLASQEMCHQLGTVANAQYRYPQLENLCADGSGLWSIYAVWATGKDNALQILHGLDFLQIQGIWMHLAVYIAFAYTAGNQLVVLATKIQDDNHFVSHCSCSSSRVFFYFNRDIIPPTLSNSKLNFFSIIMVSILGDFCPTRDVKLQEQEHRDLYPKETIARPGCLAIREPKFMSVKRT